MNLRMTKLYSLTVWSVVLILLSACAAPASEVQDESGELAKIDFAEVEVGLGSPTPVTITIDVSYPNACSQISDVTQTFVKDGNITNIKIEIRVADMGEICTEFPQSFRMVMPINASGLPKGAYSVEVNGVDAGNFEFKN
ncbi:MAG: hypothetical protein ACKOBD_00915 [Chloroflexota bacterium]